MPLKKSSGIILALDVQKIEDALKISEKVYDYIDGFKVGYPLILENGISVVDEISNFGSVIVDIKIADIPNTNRMIAKIIKKHKVDGIIAHGFVGSDSIRALVEEFSPGDVYSVAEMSHPGAIEFMQKNGIEIARISIENGVKGLILPGTRPERIKIYRENFPHVLIFSPGIGAQGGDAGKAFENGSDYIIVGRSIYESNDPVGVINKIKKL